VKLPTPTIKPPSKTQKIIHAWQVVQRPLLAGSPVVIDGVSHGYDSIAQLVREIATDDIRRPTEYDAILSMIRGRLDLTFSTANSAFGGSDRSAYSKPAVGEREKMFEQGFKWCNGYNGKVHEPDYIPLYDFYANSARRDKHDSICAKCRRHSNAKGNAA